MKHERMTFALCSSAVLIGSVISFACAMCLVEAFGLFCDPKHLIFLCCAVCGAAAMVMSVRHSGIFTLCVFVLYFACLIWKGNAVFTGAQTLLYRVTEAYAACFENVPILGVPGGDVQWILYAIVFPLAWLCVWTVCREGHTFFVVLACAPVFVLCLMIVDLAPILWLVLLTAAIMLLLLSGGARVHSASAGGRLIWILVLPVTALVTALLVLSPVESYVRSDWASRLQSVAEAGFDLELWTNKVVTAVGSHWSGELEKVDLSKVGPQSKTGVYVLQYQSDVPIEYLRGNSLGYYGENTWERVELPVSMPVEQTQLIRPSSAYSTVLIETVVGEPKLYTAYYPTAVPENGIAVDDAYLKAPGRVRGYAVHISESAMPQPSEAYDAFVQEAYLQLPEELRERLTAYLGDNGLTDASPQTIADHVKSSCVYDLDTPAVPRGKDLAWYFLTESHQGYCVHFATATVLLLRSAGIPARYVTGYAVDGPAGQWNKVTQDDAHAWVEVYADGGGWVPVDPTPADESVQVPDVEPDREEETSVDTEPSISPNLPPSSSLPSEDDTPKRQGNALWWMLLPGSFVLVFLRRIAIVYCRRQYWKRQHPNKKALLLFERVARLYRAQGIAVPEQWIALAEKAKFSRHTITAEELQELSQVVQEQIDRLKQRSFLRTLWYRFGAILY